MRGFFIRLFGITGLALRASLRTRTVGAVIVLLMACILILPCVLKGDGTPAGDLQVLFTYTLGFAFGLLALASLWTACSLFAAEIDSTRIQLTVVALSGVNGRESIYCLPVLSNDALLFYHLHILCSMSYA